MDQIEGFTCRVPKGAFYLFPNVSDVGKPSQEIENILLEDAGVASLSGTGFGRYGEGYLRFSYANSLENLEAAAARIAACEKLRT